MHHDLHLGIDAIKRFLARLNLWPANVIRSVDDLPLQI